MQKTPTTLQPPLAAQTRSSGHHERVADPRRTAVASSSLAELMSLFLPTLFFNFFYKTMYVTQTPQTTQTAAHEQCRMRATTSWLQRYTRLPPASRAGSNTARGAVLFPRCITAVASYLMVAFVIGPCEL